MKIKLNVQISGTRDGVDWPAPGGTLDVSADEAKSLISGGLAVEVEEFAIAELPDGTVIGDGESIATLPVAPDEEPVIETATAPKPETATKTRAPRAPKGK